MLLDHAKNSNDLKRDDFLKFPLWAESGNLLDEDEVAPLTADDPVDKEGVYYARTVFTLANRARADGYTRISGGRPTFMCIFVDADRTFEFSLLEEINRPLFDADPEYKVDFLQQSKAFFPLNFRIEAALEKHGGSQGLIAIKGQMPVLIR